MRVALPPILERELCLALRRGAAQRLWWRASMVLGTITISSLLVLWWSGEQLKGPGLFLVLFVFGLYLVITQALMLTADLFSEERRQGTLGLLYLTGLSTTEILLSKLLGASLTAGYSLLAGVPFFAVPLVAGGVSGSEFVGGLVCLANGLFWLVALGVLGSVVHRESGAAQLTAALLALGLCVAGPLTGWLLTGPGSGRPIPVAWLLSSPAYGVWLVLRGLSRAPHLFWANSAVTFLYGLSALVLAGRILHRTWHQESGWDALERWRTGWLAWRRGSAAWRADRRQLLERDPFAWLVSRDRTAAWAAWAWLGLVGLGWVAFMLSEPADKMRPMLSMVGTTTVHLGLGWIALYSAARPLAEARRSGALELLLTTPLSVEAILQGQRRGLWRQVRPVLVGLGVLDAGLFGLGLWRWPGNPHSTLGFIASWCCVVGTTIAFAVQARLHAVWIALWTGRPAFATLITMGTAGMMLLVLSFLLGMGLSLRASSSPLGVVCLVLMTGLTLLWSWRDRRMLTKLVNEFRLIAAAPIPSRTDPRFRRWDPDRIFPPGRWGDFPLHAAQQAKPDRSQTAG